MKKEEIVAYARQLIAAGRAPDALESLNVYAKNRDEYVERDLLLMTAAANADKNNFRASLMSKADYDVKIARLNHNLTQLFRDLPAEGNEVPMILPPPPLSPVSPSPSQPLQATRKILFLSANPRDSDYLRVGVELRRIRDGLAAASQRDQFALESEPAVQISTITRAMQQQNPAIIHFSGHGSGADGLAVEDSAGDAILFPTNGLDRLFRLFRDTVKCVVLNACYSQEQARVISQYGIYVIGMNDAVNDDAAIDFSVGFYQSLGEGRSYEFAFDIAMVNNSANLDDANTPELWLNGEKIS